MVLSHQRDVGAQGALQEITLEKQIALKALTNLKSIINWIGMDDFFRKTLANSVVILLNDRISNRSVAECVEGIINVLGDMADTTPIPPSEEHIREFYELFRTLAY